MKVEYPIVKSSLVFISLVMENSINKKETVALSTALHNTLHKMISERFSQLEGKLLTLIEAMTEDQEVRKSRKDVIRQTILDQRQISNGDIHFITERIRFLVDPKYRNEVANEPQEYRDILQSSLFEDKDIDLSR